MAIVWKNGEFREEADFRISPFDRGLCHGLSLFETLLGVDGSPRLVREHLERMRSGFARLGVEVEMMEEEGLRGVMEELLKRNGLEEGHARIRYAVSMGVGELNFLDGGRAWSWMTAARVDVGERKLRVMGSPWKCGKAEVLRGLKVGNYAEQIVALEHARRCGFDEVLFFKEGGELCEAAMANVFLIREGKLFTPRLESGCLPGVVRGWMIGSMAELGIEVVEMKLLEEDLVGIEGMFLTSSVRGPCWVGEYGGVEYEEVRLFGRVRRLWGERMSRKD